MAVGKPSSLVDKGFPGVAFCRQGIHTPVSNLLPKLFQEAQDLRRKVDAAYISHTHTHWGGILAIIPSRI